MEEVKSKYWEMDIEKVNEFNFLNEEVEEFTRRCQSSVNVRIPSLWGINRLDIQFLIGTWWCVVSLS